MAAIKKPRGKQIRSLSSATDITDLETFSGVRPLDKKFKSKTLPGKAPGVRRMRESEYSELMKSKQTVRYLYGVKEGQFKRIYDAAARAKGSTGDNLLTALELRLDNLVYRAGFAATRAQARQMVSHGHVVVNEKRLNIPSYKCRIGDVVQIKEQSQQKAIVQFALEIAKQKEDMTWLTVDASKFKVTISDEPSLDRLHELFKVNHVVELYSK
ncbi:MAG: 30S ribosomal protein S4 [Legionellales bacterium]|nr:30S ribosomal protein S4 [Legionellales bacterium]